ncbi:pao retrotransposon peptidase domain-containing protein [Ditylenchus destructor]|uniref:Pao retrotransposon peptidase domain-containing protein n=1 Tax=Ditylenchus destructor TaxID=166010 RepID=A0AAD4N1G6_9BILA|nr:pao retrotransposon peptidase domain-containing protein [Ditylenchus destructor]
MSAPFRQLIGPAKSRLQRYTTEVDDLLLDNRPEDEDQHLFLRDARLLKTRLINVIALLSDQNNRWQQYIASLPEERQAAANQEYSDFDTGEDAFTSAVITELPLLFQTGIRLPTERPPCCQRILDRCRRIRKYSVPQPNQTNEGLFQSPPNYNRGLFQPTNEEAEGCSSSPKNEGDNLFQLPPIKMLRFNGNRADWASFWDMFNVGVHSRMLSRIKNTHGSSAYSMVKPNNSSKGILTALTLILLSSRLSRSAMDKQKILAENLQAELLNMLPAQDNTDSLRKTSEAIDRICRQMKLLGHSEEQPVLHTAIKAKFSPICDHKVVEKQLISTTSPTVTQLREDISQVIAVREEVQRTLSVLKPEQPKKDEPRRPDPKRVARPSEQARAFSVTLKKGGEPASKTSSVTPQKGRKAERNVPFVKRNSTGLVSVRNMPLPMIALRAKSCPSRRNCQNCQGKHHIILCPQLNKKEVKVTNSVTNEHDVTSATVSQCLVNLPESEVLLMATDVKVSSPTNPGIQLTAFVFFDNGSQPSFIRTDYADKLGLRKLTNGELEVHHFNADEPQRFRSPKYALHIHQKDGTIRKVVVNGTKKICLAKLYAVLSSSNKEPDLLIGMRDFWQFIDKVERITPGLTIVHTTVGPMICGETQGQLSPQREVVTNPSRSCQPITSSASLVSDLFYDDCKTHPIFFNNTAPTVQHHLDLEAKESADDCVSQLATELKNNMYVDDGTLGAESQEEALFKCLQSKLIFQRAGMNLRGYLVNSDVVMSQLPEEDRSSNDNPNPAILPAKIFFQALWTKDHTWDSPLNNEESSTWTQLQRNWHDQRITVQRRADASTAHLIFSKNRLKPKEGVTIPRLELLAILIGTRALKFVRQELHRPIKRQVLWSDSQCALRWIASTDDNSKFVTNRLREIRLTDCEFRFVPTALNPADLSTRGCSVQELKSHPLWWIMPPPDTGETFEDEPTSSTVMAIAALEPVPKLINAERFSSWNTLVRTTMIAMRFLKHRVKVNANSTLMQKRKWLSITSEGPFNAEDYKLATFIPLQLHQQEKSISDREMANLKFFKDQDGLIRLRSRMGNADWTEDSIHPIVLWKDTHFVRLLIRQIHEQSHHTGLNATLTEFLAKYWTRHARKNVRKALSECMQCRRMLAKPYSLPPMPDHPKQRVRASQIWENIGLDYLDTTTFINGFRRFVARRGKPRWVLSDNATGFKAASACIAAAWQETLNHTQKDPYFTEHEIYWKFIPELAPWFGSTYERLVAIAKDAFRKTVGKNVLTFDELQTFVSEVEASMNHRPLTYVTTDAEGILPLRPIDFIQPKALVLLEAAIEPPKLGKQR